jgi:uracil-DNA glycosylase
LQSWADAGVLLLNTSLTTEIGERDKHKLLGWENLIAAILAELSSRDVVAILWGNSAKTLGSTFMHKIESAHPSPLSAYRGFFGSRPFSQSNELLASLGRDTVNWRLP